jgi:hypothetical protein
MNFARGHFEARWLPSRYDAAIFRLVAFARLSSALRRGLTPESDQVILFVDRNQSVAETYLTATWMTLTFAAFTTFVLSSSMSVWLALATAVPATLVLIEVPLYVSGLVLRPIWNRITGRRNVNGMHFTASVYLLLMLGLSLHFTRSEEWVRFVAWQFLGVVALNLAAVPLVHLLRSRIERAEQLAGGSPSEA